MAAPTAPADALPDICSARREILQRHRRQNPRRDEHRKFAQPLGFSVCRTTYVFVDRIDTKALPSLPIPFTRWFAEKGWQPRAHQLELLARTEAGESTLLIAPTGAGKTLAGFLPSLTDLTRRGKIPPGSGFTGVHTLYISPLKALAVDIERNLMKPVEEMGLAITVENRTGDTPSAKRQRQKLSPPDILLTTPEQVALLLANGQAERFFKDLRYIVLDELHSLVSSKRGHMLSLGLARLRRLAPNLQTIGLSATVAEPMELQKWLVAQREGEERHAGLVTVAGGAKPNISILSTEERIPWAGHSAKYAIPDVYKHLLDHKTTLLFVNTRSQAEMLFQELWTVNDDNLPIALHHGSLDVGQRRKVEAAMAANKLRAVVATSTLDLGIDWGDVDLVIHVGAPKGASRLAQRIGRANHRMDEPSKAILVPANRFEVMECQAALDANYLGAQDTLPVGKGTLDVLAQHVLGMACAEPFDPLALYDEIVSASPYADLSWERFEQIVDFVATGGYALRTYERYARIRKQEDGRWRVSNPGVAQQYRLNSGTIVEAPMLNLRMVKRGAGGRIGRGGATLGKMEEYFFEQLSQGDTFVFSGKVLRFEGIRENEALASQAYSNDPKIPSYNGGKFPLSTYLADQVRSMLADPDRWHELPDQVRDWLALQREKSMVPKRDELLIETFPRGSRAYMVAYPFEGRLAHQTLGMLLTRRLERAGAKPLGFVATDYSLGIWGLEDMGDMVASGQLSLSALFDEDMLGDDLEEWLDESFLLKRTFRNCAVISGLIERRHPGKEKSGRQVTVSTDLIYDVLRSHEPDHILLQATRQDAATGLLDIARLGDMLRRIKGHITHRPLDHISPLAVPVMLEIGRESVPGEAHDHLLAEAADDLIAEALA
jgi:ATP-dependent Lhr-like helicase